MFRVISFIFFTCLSSALLAQEPATITVIGNGTVSSTPDMATVNLGVLTVGKDASEALSQNSAVMQKVIDTLKTSGVADRDVQTSQLNLNPQWDRRNNNGQPPKITGYQANNNVTIRVRELKNLGKVLDLLSKAGANNMNGVSFGLQERDAILNQARQEAVLNAREKALLYAQAAGIELGKVLAITEAGTSRPRPMARMAESMAMDSVPIAEGTVDTSASVTVVYEIVQ